MGGPAIPKAAGHLEEGQPSKGQLNALSRICERRPSRRHTPNRKRFMRSSRRTPVCPPPEDHVPPRKAPQPCARENLRALFSSFFFLAPPRSATDTYIMGSTREERPVEFVVMKLVRTSVMNLRENLQKHPRENSVKNEMNIFIRKFS